MVKSNLNRKNQSLDYFDKLDKADFKYKISNDDNEPSYSNKLHNGTFYRGQED